MKREDVYKEIDIEIDYANKKWVDAHLRNDIVDKEQPILNWVDFMYHHLKFADYDCEAGKNESALSEIRKVVALGVTALEIYGCPSRNENNSNSQNLDGDGC
jgi:CRISPR/Cas system Type II protein with McrA/HNH and RuvC-like nuclease domain